MKLIHTADLHIGKRICEHSMLENQRDVLWKMLAVIEAEKPDAVLIAGDVYDKPVPTAEAVCLLDDFMVELSKLSPRTFIISGNHDSAERIAFGGRLMESRGIFLSPVYSGEIKPTTLKDEFGEVDVWMLPFVRPNDVRSRLVDDDERKSVTDYTTAVKVAIGQMKFTPGRRNILVAHQFVTGAMLEEKGSEEFVGGISNVDPYVFDGFDYVALGHIHGPQNLMKDEDGIARIRYSGTPLKYSLSEAKHKKSMTVVELGGVKNPGGLAELQLREIPLEPLHDMRQIRGSFDELTSVEFRDEEVRQGRKLDDFIYAVLTDDNDVPNAAAKLRSVYPNLMMLNYDNARTQNLRKLSEAASVVRKTPIEIFCDFFRDMNGRGMNQEEFDYVDDLVNKIWDGEKK